MDIVDVTTVCQINRVTIDRYRKVYPGDYLSRIHISYTRTIQIIIPCENIGTNTCSGYNDKCSINKI